MKHCITDKKSIVQCVWMVKIDLYCRNYKTSWTCYIRRNIIVHFGSLEPIPSRSIDAVIDLHRVYYHYWVLQIFIFLYQIYK